jgi:hypothetical protein
VKKLFYMLIVAMVTPLLSGCNNGSTAEPPSNFTATKGDGRVKVTWTASPGVDYWLFTATDPSLSAFNWTGLPNHYAYGAVASPFYMCGLFNGTTYYFAANGRSNGGPGGSSSPTINATPYNASATWTAIPTPTNGVPLSTNLYGVGYTSLTTCGNNATISSTGIFAAVGAGGAIFTSNDGKFWSPEISPVPVTTPVTNLNAVTGYAANQNNALTPALRWMAVGDAGTVAYYQDGTGWVLANNLAGSTLNTANPNSFSLRSITQVAGTFYAVGDAGTIISSSDAINWYRRPYSVTTPINATAQNLNGVTHGGIYVAVGDNGTILTSGDGNNWAPLTTPPAIPTGINLRQVTSYVSIYGTIYVAVGDAGTIVTSTNISGGLTWTTQTALPGLPNLVGITAESRAVDTTTAVADHLLGFISTAQFVAIDSTGNAYTSPNGYTWTSVPVSTGTTTSTGISNLSNLGQPMVSSGFGYVAVGNAGATASAF